MNPSVYDNAFDGNSQEAEYEIAISHNNLYDDKTIVTNTQYETASSEKVASQSNDLSNETNAVDPNYDFGDEGCDITYATVNPKKKHALNDRTTRLLNEPEYIETVVDERHHCMEPKPPGTSIELQPIGQQDKQFRYNATNHFGSSSDVSANETNGVFPRQHEYHYIDPLGEAPTFENTMRRVDNEKKTYSWQSKIVGISMIAVAFGITALILVQVNSSSPKTDSSTTLIPPAFLPICSLRCERGNGNCKEVQSGLVYCHNYTKSECESKELNFCDAQASYSLGNDVIDCTTECTIGTGDCKAILHGGDVYCYNSTNNDCISNFQYGNWVINFCYEDYMNYINAFKSMVEDFDDSSTLSNTTLAINIEERIEKIVNEKILRVLQNSTKLSFLMNTSLSSNMDDLLEKLDSMEFSECPTHNFPSGAVIPFALSECPSGWQLANGDKWENPPSNISRRLVNGQEARFPDLMSENRFIRAGSSKDVGKIFLLLIFLIQYLFFNCRFN